MNWPEEIYSFTKPGKAIVTWKFVMTTEDGRAEYFSNYNQTNWISKMQLENYYYTSLEDCYEAWIDSIEQFKKKVIKQFEKKCGIDYYEYSKTKFKTWLETQPDIKAQLQKVKDEMDKSK